MRYGFIALALSLFAQPAFAQTGSGGTQNSWAGFYGGVDAGIRHSRYDFFWTDLQDTVGSRPGGGVQVVPFNTVATAGRITSTDAVYGGLIGWSGQSGHFVYGLEASAHRGGPSEDVSYKTSQVTLSIHSVFARHLRTQGDAALRARAGYAFGRTLLYAAGGVTAQRIRIRVSGTFNSEAAIVNNVAVPALSGIVTSGSQTRNFTGWTAGGGIEQRLSRHFSIGLDARYDRLSGSGFTVPNQATTAPASSFYGSGAGAALPAPPISRVSATGHEPRGDMAATARLVFHF